MALVEAWATLAAGNVKDSEAGNVKVVEMRMVQEAKFVELKGVWMLQEVEFIECEGMEELLGWI